MKILQVSNARGWTGGTQQVLLLCQELQNRGEDVTLVTNTESELGKRASIAGLRVHPVKMRQDYDLWAAWQLKRLIEREKYDIVHAHHPTSHAICLIAAKLSGFTNFVVTRRVSFRPKSNPFSRWKYRSRSVKKYVAVSRHVAGTLIRYGVKSERLSVIPDAIELNFTKAGRSREFRDQLGIRADEILIGNVGSYSPFKGYEYLVRAARLVLKEHPNCRFLFCGGGTQRLSKLAQELGIAEKIILLSFRDDIPEVLASLDMFVLSSLEEGLSLAGIEAMASGLPLVGTQAGGIPDIISEENGILVPPANSQALADAIAKLVADPELRRHLGKEGRRKVEQFFSIEKVADQILQLYRASLNGSG